MSKTYTWRIIDSAIIPNKDGMENIVHKVHYIKRVVEEIDGKKFTFDTNGNALPIRNVIVEKLAIDFSWPK